MTDPVPTFGRLLRAHRLSAGLTQEALAERAGLSARGIQDLERCVTKPLRDTALRVAQALALLPEEHARFVAAALPLRRQPRGVASERTQLDFPQLVSDALRHLHDPVYLQAHRLIQFVPHDQQHSGSMMAKALRQSLIVAIEVLRPSHDAAASSDAVRPPHGILHLHYVDGLDAAVVQDRLGISQSTYYREHQRALDAVISVLREQWRVETRERLPEETRASASDTVDGRTSHDGLRQHPHVELPVYLSTFIGREREVAAVTRLLGTSRLLTLAGPGGVGKTRLAVLAAAGLASSYPDGVWFASLSPLRDPDLVLPTIAQTLGAHIEGDRPVIEQLRGFLADEHLLLVLDNFEHVVTAAAQVVGLLTACPHLRVLVTSREPLHVAGEQEYPVPPLSLSGPVAQAVVTDPVPSEAVQLFVDRARRVRPDFVLTTEDFEAVDAICHRLDGLPLAIELAAARIKLLPPHALLGRLERRLPLLTGGGRDLPARQQTLRNTIAWSYDLLEEPERALFRRLGVFVGGCTLEAAGAVCFDVAKTTTKDEQAEASELLDGIASLVDKSLLVVSDNAPEGVGGQSAAPRYGMLETIREYALQSLSEFGQLDAPLERHAAYFLNLVERAESELEKSDQARWLDRLEEEHDNIRAALHWLSTRGASEAGQRMGGALWQFWFKRGHLVEGRDRLADLLTPPARTKSSIALAKALHATGMVAGYLGDWDKATALERESLAMRIELGDRPALADSLRERAVDAAGRGDYASARALHEESIAIHEESGNVLGIAKAYQQLAWNAVQQGDFAAAMVSGQQSLTKYRQHGDIEGVVWMLLELGRWTLGRDDAAAKQFLLESLTLSRDLGHGWGLAHALLYLASGAANRAQPVRALCLAGAAATTLRTVGTHRFDPVMFAECEQRLDVARRTLGSEASAAAWAAGQALTLDEAIAEALWDDTGA